MAKKTHEQYVEELKIKNPNVIALDKYISVNTKILHKCLIHDYEWMTTPASVLKGCGCPMCHKEKQSILKSKTHDDYVKELAIKNQEVEVLEIYKGADIPIKHLCKIHNVIWNVRPSNVLQGNGCKKCGIEKYSKSNRRTNEQYISELYKINPDIEVLEEYITTHSPILHRCKIDGYEWNAKPSVILSGGKCPKCSNNIKRTHESYVEELKVANPNVVVLEEYINTHTSILHKCKIHDEEWKISPAGALKGNGCPICWREKQGDSAAKTHEEYVKEISKLNPDITVVGTYERSKTPLLHKCNICSNEWEAVPSSIINGNGCPKCKRSHGEKEIASFLDNNNIIYYEQYRFDDCKYKRSLPFDFYIPSLNKVIEYDGVQHMRPVSRFGGQEGFEETLKRDKIKDEYCKNNGIELLRIPYTKFDNIEEELNNFLFI